MAGADQRTSPRVAATFRVEYESFDKFLLEYAEDISQGGIFLATDYALPIGTVVRLVLNLPESQEKVPVLGQVVHQRSGSEPGRSAGMGVEFLDIDDGALAKVKAFVDARLRPEARGGARPSRSFDTRQLDAVLAVPDTRMAAAIEAALGAQFRARQVGDGVRALSDCIARPPRLVVAAVDIGGMSAVDLLRALRARDALAALPFILCDEHVSDAVRAAAFEAGADDVMAWPVPEAELRARIDRILLRTARGDGGGDRRALRGELSDVSLPSLLGLLEMERKSGYLLVMRDGETAALALRDGAIVRAEVRPACEGIERVFYVLDWSDGRFEFVAQDVLVPDEVGMHTSHLLIEHARSRDEALR